ncbi:MAG: PAS domain S-box protein, partial [Bacteroidales bacterium]|nr:PAS domain S-box protein [Bacteroidales bacterium]
MKTDELLQSLAGQLFDTTSDAMFIMAAEPNGVFRCIAVNKSYFEKTRLSREQVIGKTHKEILPKNSAETAFHGYLTAIKTKKTNRYIESIDFGFGLNIVETTITPVFDIAGNCTYLIGASRDIKALTETETKLGLMTQTLQSVNDGVSITDLDNKIIYANDAFCKMYGYQNQEEIINKDISIVCSTVGVNTLEKIVNATLNGGWNGELINQRKDGSSFPIQLSASPVFDHKGNIFALVGICNDISEEKETENKLQTHEKWIQSIAENSPDIIYVYNVREHRNVYYSQSILQHLGYDKNELDEYAPGFFEKIIHPDDLSQYDEFFENIGNWEKGRVFSFEYRLKTKSGEWRWFKGSEKEFERSNGSVISMIGTARDITEMKAAREALSRSEEKYRLLADNSSDAIALYNNKYELLYLSPATSTLSGYSIEELLEKNFMDIVYPPDREALQNKIQIAVANRVKHDSLIYRFVHKTGKLIWVETNSNRIFDTDGNLQQIITVNRDITLRKKAEEILEEQNKKFRFLSRSVTEMLELPNLHSVYNYIITNLHIQYPDTVALFVTINEKLMESKLESIVGLDNKVLKKVIELSGQNPVGKIFNLLPGHQRLFKTGKFLTFEGGLAEFAATEFPEFASTLLHKLLGINKIYTIGINNNENLLAAIHIFSLHNTVITDEDYVETFIHQAGALIQRKMIEEQLRFQSMILDQIQDRVTVTDLHGSISYVNNSVIKMLKVKPENLLGKSVTTYGNDEASQKKQEEIVAETIKNGTWRGEVENFDTSGKKLILEVRTQVIKNKDNQAVALCGISTDITQRKAQELLIKQSQERYRNLFNSMSEGFSLCKIITDEAYNPIDWEFIELNPAHERHTGLINEELIGKRISEVYPDIESRWLDFYG